MHKTLTILISAIILIGGIFIILQSNKNYQVKNNNSLLNQSTPMINQPKEQPQEIRQPAVAGQFYPADPQELTAMIDKFLAQVKLSQTKGMPQILILPHAGYVFSGQTAAYGFKTLENNNYNNIIILGSSHNYPVADLILYNGDAIETPLGLIPVNKDIVTELEKNKLIKSDNSIHEPEHSLEVEVPFLQKVLTNFKVVFGLINNDNPDELESIADSIEKLLEKYPQTLIVVSSDLSHYPSYDDAVYSDNKIMQSILTKNPANLVETTRSIMSENRPGLDTCACGSSAIKLAMFLADKLNLNGQILHSSNSGDIELYGDKDKVVGYGAIVFTATAQEPTVSDYKLNDNEKQIALKLARQTLELEFDLSTEKSKDYKNYTVFSEKRGVFVTLKKEGQLRGCVGLIEPIQPLAQGIIQMAKAAAFNDIRFAPLGKKELTDIQIEVSVLTPPQKITDPEKEIELGKHGVIVRSGNNSGVYLPQVATDIGWDLQTFMDSLCTSKANLPADCWKNGQADIYTFEAQVFGE
jgi:AmmeMemoRadiSam system protein B/AmmeMemoRadiSam system protein A